MAKQQGKERRRIGQQRHFSVDAKTHKIICADLSQNNVTYAEAFPGLIRQIHRKIRSAAADGSTGLKSMQKATVLWRISI
ncbi:putative transposase [Erwinia amylovora]|uniref:Probable transposase for transposon Tn903 n=3 Tax=Erwinia amylovora TaxID=552 RepID=D4I0T4_ERWAC|nr:putative transposase for transposon [Erwinia amylovora ACW56400]QJQ53263.1 putative transposase [Erwinia amylovora]CBA22925.1 probable transposase for transposon Tn903 [Erwinia amylovora CFBP1430]CBX81941.1 probable transposase for transposon Tn903 [Erwinia amylovora ATCC BAA-2158]CCO83721.1 putative transposase for transposon [Erwinia amylovora Ea266]CCO87482.1 putative transposase for transposon [Erwinia amylovora CFBP 2585]CCO91276.1 putative transposase for transposon [Erwinia amylovor